MRLNWNLQGHTCKLDRIDWMQHTHYSSINQLNRTERLDYFLLLFMYCIFFWNRDQSHEMAKAQSVFSSRKPISNGWWWWCIIQSHTHTHVKKWFKFIVQTSTDESSERAKCRNFVLQMPECPWFIDCDSIASCICTFRIYTMTGWLPGGREIMKVMTTTTNEHLFAARSSGRTCANHLSQWIGSNARLSAK